jgi:hypothetical protein
MRTHGITDRTITDITKDIGPDKTGRYDWWVEVHLGTEDEAAAMFYVHGAATHEDAVAKVRKIGEALATGEVIEWTPPPRAKTTGADDPLDPIPF